MKRLVLEILIASLLISIFVNVPSFQLARSDREKAVAGRQALENYEVQETRVAMSSSDNDWRMFHHDLNHTGYSPSKAPDTDNLLWNYTTQGAMHNPAVAEGRVYVGSDDKNVYCLNTTDGTFIWSYATGGSVYTCPAVDNGLVFLGSVDANVYAINAATGALAWYHATGAPVTSSPAVAEDRIYIGSNDTFLHCLNATTGDSIWTYKTSGPIESSPAVVEGKVYFGSDDFHVYCLNASTGTQIWSYLTGDSVYSSPSVANGRVYAGSHDGYFYCLNASTGVLVWRYASGPVGYSSPAVTNDVVYVGSAGYNVYCLNAATGTKIWSYARSAPGWFSSPAVADGKVYIGDNRVIVYCLNATNGDSVWTYAIELGGVISSSPAVADGKVYVGSNDNNIYEFGAFDWWPMFHHRLNHAGYSSFAAPDTNSTIWTYTTTGPVVSSPAVADGKIYVGSDDFNVYCLDSSTGSLVWEYATGDRVDSSPAIAYGMVYVGSFDKKIYALNATTGSLIWSYTTADIVYSSPSVTDGIVYVGSIDSKVYALNATTGTLIWNYSTGASVSSSPAVAYGRVYVGSEDDRIYCLNASTGTYMWDYPTMGAVESSPAVVNGMVYVGSYDCYVYCLNASDGDQIWIQPVGHPLAKPVFSSPAVAYGRIYVGAEDDALYCFNATTGDRLWYYETGHFVESSPAVADGKVYVGSADKKVYCLNALTGKSIWNYTAGDAVYSSPAVASRTVYIGSEDSKVYAFETPTIHLESVPALGYSINLGITTLDGLPYSLPNDVSESRGTYSVKYAPASGYGFDHWETAGGVTVTDPSSNPAYVTVINNGTLRAVYMPVHDEKPNYLQFKFYTGQSALFTGLLNDEIDVMAWPLTYAQYQTAITSAPDITVAPYFDLGDYEIAFNNNMTDPSHAADRKAMNYTEFRQAIACLVDKDGLISGPTVNNFGTRIDTAIPRPILNNWVDLNPASPTCVSKYDAAGNLINKYPWDYNPTQAITILWNANFYSHVTYPSLPALIAMYPSIPANSVVYPPGHPRAGTPIDQIVAYIRSDHLPRKTAGENLINEMTHLGIPHTGLVHEGSSGVCYTPVFIDHDYDFYTASWSFGTHPLFFYSMYTPAGIYPGGPNIYMIDDWNMTYHAEQEYPLDTIDSPASSAYAIQQAKMCEYRAVQEAMLVPLYTSRSYMAYRNRCVGIINSRGYGLTDALDFTFLNSRVESIRPIGSTSLRYGTLNPPEQINPIFSSYLEDYEVVDRIFCSPMNINPYQTTSVGKSPAGGDLPWMAYDWNYQLSNFNGGGGLGNPADSYTNMANVTYWFRHDITWQDGITWSVDDFNYTIYVDKTYGDSWGQSDMMHVVNFVKWDNWTCSLYFDIPTFWALYTPLYNQVPMHIYNKIDIPADAPSGSSTTGHHGEWPGKDAFLSEVHAPLPFPIEPENTLVGTGMWQYVPGTYVSGTGGGLICKLYPGFWMNITQGDIDFKYTWNAGPAPQDGSYVIGLSDLVLLANAYGTSGIPPVPFKLGGLHVWEPGCDLASPAGVVGLSDLVTLAVNYGKHWGWGLSSYNVISTCLDQVEVGSRNVGAVPISMGTTLNNIALTGFNTEHTFIGLGTGTRWWSVPLAAVGKTFYHWDVWMEDANTIHIEAVYK